MSKNTVPIENANERDRFIDKAIEEFLETPTMRNASVTASVSGELSRNNRRGLSTDERRAVEGAAADKLRKRFGGG